MSAAPSFAHVGAWVFDLDNTLYPAASDLFSQIDRRMRAYVGDLLGVDEATAHAIQKRYYREHGTTMLGLMRLHGVDPHHFMDYVHDIDLSPIAPCARLADGLARLPGRRIVFTNGSVRHAENVMSHLGIARFFDAVFDIAAAGFTPKPQGGAYDRMIAATAIAPREAAMFEDIARNLVPAHALGMTTVLVRSGPDFGPPGTDGDPLDHVHHTTGDLAQFLGAIAVAEPAGARP